MKPASLIILIATLFVPLVSYAETTATFATLVGQVVGLINKAIPVVASLILLVFFWGIAKYVLANADSTKKAEGKELIIWGLIGIFVTFSIWGIVNVLKNTLIQ